MWIAPGMPATVTATLRHQGAEMPESNPTVRGRALGAELRRLREAANLSGHDVARILDVSPSKISRMETGKRGVKVEDVAAVLALYRVSNARREELLELARGSNEPGWLQRFGASMPKELKSLMDQENDAIRIRNYETMYVPGLLQTGEYTRSIMRRFVTVPADEIDARVQARAARQTVLSREDRPELWMIIEESVLRRPTGGPIVMAGQLRYLVDRARRPDIHLRVLPHSLGSHAGMSGPFVLMDFATATPIVHLENAAYSYSLEDRELIAAYNRIFNRLADEAMDEGESAEFVAELAREFAERSDSV